MKTMLNYFVTLFSFQNHGLVILNYLGGCNGLLLLSKTVWCN